MSNSDAANALWLGPEISKKDGVMYTNPGGHNSMSCTNCHDADPFILSPYIQQVVSKDMLARWNATGKHNVDKFGWFTPVSSRPWVVRDKKDVPQATDLCTACHRIGKGSLAVITQHELVQGGQANFHGYMPTEDTSVSQQQWRDTYGATMAALDKCLNLPSGEAPAAACNAVRAGQIVN